MSKHTDPHDHGRTIDYATLTKRERRLVAAALYDAAADVTRYPRGYFGSRYAIHWWLRQRAWRIRDGLAPLSPPRVVPTTTTEPTRRSA